MKSFSLECLYDEYFQGSIFINDANVTYSDDISVNGIFHEIDKVLFAPDLDNKRPPAAPVRAQLNSLKMLIMFEIFIR